jgi:dCTP deaminase
MDRHSREPDSILEVLFVFGYRVRMLSNLDIADAILATELKISPYSSDYLQPSSYDVHLGSSFLVFDGHKSGMIDPAVDNTHLVHYVRQDEFVLHPGEFVLATTVEVVTLSAGIAARIEGKSSLGRLGLQTHSTAGFIDPGFAGTITLELSNVARLPIKLYAGMKIGQLAFFRLDTPTDQPYGSNGSHYQNQSGPQASRGFVNFEDGDTFQFQEYL